jgi:alkylated DNA repair protein (DNA oxidative demethylase)
MIEIARNLSIDEQGQILETCQTVIEEAPLFIKTMPGGAAFRYRCTSAGSYGWISDKKGFRYVDAHPVTSLPFPQMPPLIEKIAIETVSQYGLHIRPESALINWYDHDGTLGLHQDKTEISRAPVVSISIGDDCVFIVGGLKRTDKKREFILKSGDVLIFGAEDRLIFHGVKKILPKTAPPELGLKQAGRWNITVRQVYD